MAPINDVLSATRNTISSYRTLAEKAVRAPYYCLMDDFGNVVLPCKEGTMFALKRFFHKLEFLLKHGHLPSAKDADEERLPSELQGLKAFLKNSSGEAGDSYVLQRNNTERYRFSWRSDGKLDVMREKSHIPPAGVRSGYIGEEWRRMTNTENVKADSVLKLFDNGKEETKTEKSSQSGSSTETPSVAGPGEPAVSNDTSCSDYSDVRVDTTTPAVSSEAASPSGTPMFAKKLTAQDLSSKDLAGRDLSGYDLSGLDLTGFNLSGAILTGAILTGANLSDQNLSYLNLSGAKLSGAKLSGANLSGANLSGANLFRANLFGADLFRANLSGANLFWANLFWANLFWADLSGADLSGVYLTGAILSSAKLPGANLENANLENANLENANLENANLEKANLEKANLEKANLEKANLEKANLENANLENANLLGAVRFHIPD